MGRSTLTQAAGCEQKYKVLIKFLRDTAVFSAVMYMLQDMFEESYWKQVRNLIELINLLGATWINKVLIDCLLACLID